MTYQIFYISFGRTCPLSELEPEKFGIEFKSPEEASECFHAWVDAGFVNYPKATFIILPVIK